MHLKKTDIGLAMLLVLLVGCFVSCCVIFFGSDEMAGLARQRKEEKLAGQFLEDARNRTLKTGTLPADETCGVADGETSEEAGGETGGETDGKSAPAGSGMHAEPGTETAPASGIDLDYADTRYFANEYGVHYTPDYAVGALDCVLEIPRIKLRRGVYTGTAEEIRTDLAYWMVTTAVPGYRLGETVYCIYGHNSPVQGLSFNDLWTLEPGDIFLLTSVDSVYLYDVTGLSYEFREVVQADIARNFALPADKCFIATCAQGAYAGRDLVVEGTLRNKYTLAEWQAGGKESIQAAASGKAPATQVSAEAAQAPAAGQASAEAPVSGQPSAVEKTAALLSAKIIGEDLVVTLRDASGKGIPDARIAVTDSDGIFLPAYAAGVPTDKSGSAVFPLDSFTPGENYFAGVLSYHDQEESYVIPPDLFFTVNADSGDPYLMLQDPASGEQGAADYYMVIWSMALTALFLLIVLCTILFIRSICSNCKASD